MHASHFFPSTRLKILLTYVNGQALTLVTASIVPLILKIYLSIYTVLFHRQGKHIYRIKRIIQH